MGRILGYQPEDLNKGPARQPLFGPRAQVPYESWPCLLSPTSIKNIFQYIVRLYMCFILFYTISTCAICGILFSPSGTLLTTHYNLHHTRSLCGYKLLYTYSKYRTLNTASHPVYKQHKLPHHPDVGFSSLASKMMLI